MLRTRRVFVCIYDAPLVRLVEASMQAPSLCHLGKRVMLFGRASMDLVP